MNIKEFGQKTFSAMTTPTAFSWYGIIGVVATGVTTFLAACKWKESVDTIEKENPLKKWWKAEPKQKIKDAAKTALIFAGPVAIGVGTCYCIKHGNDGWAALYGFKCTEVGDLMIANNLLTDKAKAMATGAAIAKLESKKDEYELVSPNYSFSDDPEGEVEDYGKKVLFYDEYCESWFESTIFDVIMAEEQLHKLITIRGYAALGEFRSLLHLSHEDWMYLNGWDLELGYKRGQYGWVDFVHNRRFLDDGRVYYILRYCNSPTFVEEFEYDYGYIKNVRDGS